MGLRAEAEQDLTSILEDDTRGGAWPITVTNPAGLTKPLKGWSNDITQLIDPDTGQSVSGRLASVSLRISSLVTAGYATLPVGISDANITPWVVTFDDINGNAFTFKVIESNPDRAMGIVTCLLGLYTP